MNGTILQDRVTDIIKPLIPPDAEERVNRSFKQWNQIIRDHIRTETGLKLSDGDNRFAIPVRVIRGFPVTLAQRVPLRLRPRAHGLPPDHTGTASQPWSGPGTATTRWTRRKGRGWAVLKGDEHSGMIFFHQGDDSEFVAKRVKSEKRSERK